MLSFFLDELGLLFLGHAAKKLNYFILFTGMRHNDGGSFPTRASHLRLLRDGKSQKLSWSGISYALGQTERMRDRIGYACDGQYAVQSV